MAAHSCAQIKCPFSCCLTLVVPKLIFQMQQFDQGWPMKVHRDQKTFTSLDNLESKEFEWGWMKWKEMLGGGLFCNLANFFVRIAVLKSWFMIAYGKCNRCYEGHYSCNGDKFLDSSLMMFCPQLFGCIIFQELMTEWMQFWHDWDIEGILLM